MNQLDGQTGISVTGTGRMAIDAEIATLQVGVNLTDKNLEDARAAAASKLNEARNHLTSSGVAVADIKTTRLNVHTSFDRSVRRQIYHLTTGFDATIRDLGSAESIVNELFDVIGDGMDMRGLTFGVEDPSTGRAEAIELAFEDAKAKATHLARLAGVALGPVLAISEAEPAHYEARPMMRSAVAQSSADIPIEAGELDQRATVSVRWAVD
ncbi:MAG: SIMPL domain-containing protein [Acidimicrobiales bacterium]